MKRFISIVFVTLFTFCLFAYDGIISGEGKLKVASTKWFDIIYPESSKETASILYLKADDLYVEITASLGIEPDFRMPVVITPGTEQFNAYFTNYPYNHIVIYDTGIISSLEVFSETIYSTFKHELTHAITLNMKSPAIKLLSNIWGDPISLSSVIVSSGMAEGATLCSEASTGEGRLNNTIAMSSVIQAKIENQLPGYFDETGVSTIYPAGSFYQFNGVFHNWLQEKYGMEKYAQFWYSAVNIGGDSISITIGQVFKKTYGISLNDAWKMCFDEYEVPQVSANPVETGEVNDLFKPLQNKYSALNKNGGLYTSITASDKGIYYLDDDTYNIYFVSKGDRVNHKILNYRYVQSISVSDDNRFLVLNYLTIDGANYKKRIAVYDLEKKSTIYLNENGVQEGSVVKFQNEYYLVCQKFKSQNYELMIKKLIIRDNKLKGFEDEKSIGFPLESLPQSICSCDAENGDFIFIKKEGLKYSICRTSIKNPTDVTEYVLPQGYNVQNLSWDGDRAIFTYANKNTMARLGFLDFSKNEFEFDKRDLSGGVYFPVKFDENEIAYAGNFFRCNRLLSIKVSVGDRVKVSPRKINPETEKNTLDTTQLKENLEKLDLASKNYNQFSSYLKGFLMPTCAIESISDLSSYGEANYVLPFGLTYITSNPWGGNLLQLSAGYGIDTNSGAIQIGIQDTSWLDTSFTASVEFDKYGFKQTNGSLSLEKSFLIGRHSSFVLGSSSFIHFGRKNLDYTEASINAENTGNFFGNAISDDMTNYFLGSQTFSVGFKNLIYTKPGRFSRLGYSLTGYGIYNFDSKADFSDYSNKIDAAFALDFYIPQLLPISNNLGFTYNLPVVLSINTLGIKNNNSDMLLGQFPEIINPYDFNGFNFGISSILFATEIQKSLFNCTGLYAQNFTLSLLYKTGFDIDIISPDPYIIYVKDKLGELFQGNQLLSQKLYLRGEVNLSPNIGSLGSSMQIGIFGDGGLYFDKNFALSPFADFGIALKY